MGIRVLLADDHRMFREAIRAILATEPDIDIVGETSSGADTLAAVEETRPDVLVLDIGLPDINGIEVARKFAKLHAEIRIVILSGYSETIYIAEMLDAGVNGYVVKSAGADELISAIRAVAGGCSFFSPQVSHVLAKRLQNIDRTSVAPPPSVLGNREKEVLRLVAGGQPSRAIGDSLGISVATVEVHRRNIKQKLGLHSTADLTRYAIREGLISS